MSSCQEPTGEARCRYCGSMSTAHAIALLQTAGTHYSGSDWKYGWPHKFYIGRGKFYTSHLQLCVPDLVATFASLSRVLLGVQYGLDDRGLWYRAPRRGFGGWQTWGVVGVDRAVATDQPDGLFGPPVPDWIVTDSAPPTAPQ